MTSRRAQLRAACKLHAAEPLPVAASESLPRSHRHFAQQLGNAIQTTATLSIVGDFKVGDQILIGDALERRAIDREAGERVEAKIQLASPQPRLHMRCGPLRDWCGAQLVCQDVRGRAFCGARRRLSHSNSSWHWQGCLKFDRRTRSFTILQLIQSNRLSQAQKLRDSD